MRNWNFETEWQNILTASAAHGVDPYAVAAIRVAENGASGRDFGVLSVPAPDYASQLRIACVTMRHRLLEHGVSIFEYNHRVCYAMTFIKYFASKWAPSGVSNDPDNLNTNWVTNFWAAYMAFCDDEGPINYQHKLEQKNV